MSDALPPSKATLDKYGLSAAEWSAILARQFGACAICGNVPPSGRLVVDHDHVRGWKRLPPEKRKLHVRGLLCWLPCNRYYVGRSITLIKAEAVVRYLTAHNERMLDVALAPLLPSNPRPDSGVSG